MISQAYLAELERRFDGGDPRGAHAFWVANRDEGLDLGLSAGERRRLRDTLHIVLQMAAEAGWDHDATEKTASGQRTV